MILKEMNQEKIKELIKDQENILDKEMEKHKKFIENLSCIKCNGNITTIVNHRVPFSEGKFLPNFLAKCNTCFCEFEPYTRIIVK